MLLGDGVNEPIDLAVQLPELLFQSASFRAG